jgi:hypothetical protein
MIYTDGDVFEGNFIDDKANGKGTYIYKDGAVYEGLCFEDK